MNPIFHLIKLDNMFLFRRQIHPDVYLILLLIPLFFLSGCQNKYEQLDLSAYQYRDTKNLVKFVYDASLILEKDGLKSLQDFHRNRDQFNTPNYYLYIYDMDFTNLFHAGMKNIEGKNLNGIIDKNGKKITQLIVEAVSDTNNPHAWIHYSWWQPGKFYSVPKSSCHFKVKTPEGKELYVGGGLNYPHEEKEFVRIIVDNATRLIQEKGNEALSEISNPISQYNFREVYVFAFRKDGKMIISPVINEFPSPIKLLDCIDEVGHKPFANALHKLEVKESTWEVFMAKSKYQRALIKKCLYLHKTTMDNNEIYIGAITDLPQPSWTE